MTRPKETTSIADRIRETTSIADRAAEMISAVHDSLPYIDPEISDETRAIVDALIEQELLTNSNSPAEESKMQQAQLPKVTEAIGIDRYKSMEGQQAVINGEYISGRLDNLQLEVEGGALRRMAYNAKLQGSLELLEKKIDELRGQITGINKTRKKRQLDIKETVSTLENDWRRLVREVIEAQAGLMELENTTRSAQT